MTTIIGPDHAAALQLAEIIGLALDAGLTTESRATVAFALGVAVASFVESQGRVAPEGHRNEARGLLWKDVEAGAHWAAATMDMEDARAIVGRALKAAAKP